MDVVDVGLLALLPVTTSARAAFARAADCSRDSDGRQEPLRSLMTTIASGEPTTVVLSGLRRKSVGGSWGLAGGGRAAVSWRVR